MTTIKTLEAEVVALRSELDAMGRVVAELVNTATATSETLVEHVLGPSLVKETLWDGVAAAASELWGKVPSVSLPRISVRW